MRMLTALLLLLTVFAGTSSGLDWVNFTVARHVDTTFTAITIDNALNDVNQRMQLDDHDCSDDTPCTARFVRSGAVGTFGTTGDGLDVITTDPELNQVFGVTTHRAKVVTAVDRCAGTSNPSIIGCGICNGFGYILENWVGGNVHVHEYGHNVMGCGHRDDCAWNIMNSISIGTNNSVNSSECSGFGGSAYTQLCGNVYDGNGGPLTSSAGPYWVTCNVTVPAGQTLTIQPGVEIQFHQGLKITSSGTANADGSTSRIDLYSNNPSASLPSAIVDGPLEISNGGELIFH
jgi:hypothetical protein